MAKSKELVRLRQKKLANGNISLYLDIYVDGVRSYEFLKLYLVNEVTREDKKENERVLALANAIRSQRIIEIQNGKFGFENKNSNIRFLDYFDAVRDNKKIEAGTVKVWNCCRNYVEKIVGDTMLNSLRKETSVKLYKYIASKLSVNTANMYYTKYSCVVRRAYEEGYIKSDVSKIEKYKNEETERNYLTIEELRLLSSSSIASNNNIKVFLFSCLTGMRVSDIRKMKWCDVLNNGEYVRVKFKQKKTGGQEYLDINEEAAKLMGDRGKDKDSVFRVINTTPLDQYLRKNLKKIGITKYITFHCARHTFAVNMLEVGVDLYTVSKLLGHKDVKTTQIYAKIVDKKKRDAMDLMPKILHLDEK